MAQDKHAGGRPPMFETPEAMQQAIDAYFKDCDDKEEYYTITGLTLALGFSERKSLIDYENKDEFIHTIKKAKLRVEGDYEKSLRKRGSSGDIFGLKNFGWHDKKELEHSGKIETIQVKIDEMIEELGDD